MTEQTSTTRLVPRLLGGLGVGVLLAASAAYYNADKSHKTVTGSELDDFSKGHPQEVVSWLKYAILCDYVYHTADAPTKIPAGFFPLTQGPEKTPLHCHDAATGFYVEVFAKARYSEDGKPAKDADGNMIPGALVAVWRGSPFPYDPKSFQQVPGYPDLGSTNAADWLKAKSRIWETITQADKGERIKGMALTLEEKIQAAFPDMSVPMVHTGQSQGATNAMIAAAVSTYPNVQAIAFNGPPQGGLLVSYGLDTPATQAKITAIHSGGDTLTNGAFTLAGMAILDGLQGMLRLNDHRYGYGHYPFFFEEKAIVLPKCETFLEGHGPAGLIHSLGVLCRQSGQGAAAAEIVRASYTKSETCLKPITALLAELERPVERLQELRAA